MKGTRLTWLFGCCRLGWMPILILMHFQEVCSAEDDHDQTSRELQATLSRATSVDCLSDLIVIAVRRRSLERYGFDNRTKVSLSESSASVCVSPSAAHNNTHFRAASAYGDCGMIKTRISDNPPRFINLISILLQTGPDANGNVISVRRQVQCVNIAERQIKFQLRLWTEYYRKGTELIHFPKEIVQGSTLFAEMGLLDVHDGDIRSIPLECYFTNDSGAGQDDPKVHMLIQSMCPYSSAVSMLHTANAHQQYSQFSVQINRLTYTDRNFFFLRCRATVCSIRGGRVDEGYMDCPAVDDCVHPRQVSSSTRYPSNPTYKYVNKGPIRSVQPALDTFVGDMTPKLEECPPCEVASSAVPQPYIAMQHRAVGIPMVICISLATFLLGMTLVGSLWYIHDCTKPSLLMTTVLTPTRRQCSSDSAIGSVESRAPLGSSSQPLHTNNTSNNMNIINGTNNYRHCVA